jgi:periplasmic divalent cation tolerance protein
MSHSEQNLYKLCLTTVDKKSTARTIAKSLLKQKLVACVNISDQLTSLYTWQGKLVEDKEYLLLMKTQSQKIAALRDTLLGLHPYDTAEFIVLDIVDGSQKYLGWIDDSLE